MATDMVSLPTEHDVVAFLGQGDDPILLALAQAHVPGVTAMVRSYTRGEGFDAATHKVAEDLHAVIVSTTARSVHNPESVQRENLADYGVTPTVGWTLVELAVLNRWRKRAK